MAGASDKARFYLERYVPELQEYAQKEIFSRDEISSISAKRSDFEHILSARGSTPSDYARYATYEINLDRLRRRRCKRLGVQSTIYNGQRNVFFILERGTKKFPGDTRLWMQYIEYCRQEKANKKLAKAFTQVLRLKPREHGLWILAAKHYAESQGDMTMARSYFQRGLRFCKDIEELWIEYTKLEMVYLAKLAARRKILGLDKTRAMEDKDESEDMITLPTITAADINPEANSGVEEVDLQALQRLTSSPALLGAIPMAIFDAAMKATGDDLDLAESFFILVSGFEQVPARRSINEHILQHIRTVSPESPQAIICECRNDISTFDPQTPEFVGAFSVVLKRMSLALHDSQPVRASKLAEEGILLLLPVITSNSDLDPGIAAVLEATMNRYLRIWKNSHPLTVRVSPLVKKLSGHQPEQTSMKLAEIIEVINKP